MARRRAALPGGSWASGLLLALSVLAGCENAGDSGLRDELARIRAERDFAVVASRPERVVFAARGRRIVVEPPAGYCLDQKAIEVTRNSAFALVTDCLEDRQAELAQTSGEGEVLAIELPRSFPGILTISISGESGFNPNVTTFDAFEALLNSEPGRRLLSRGNNGGAGRIIATRRIGGSLYVLIEEDADHTSFLAPRFWRGFINVNERLVLVTVSGFSDRQIAEDGMMAFLASQLSRLRQSNGLGPDAEEDQIASQLASVFAETPEDSLEVVRSERDAVSEDGVAPGRAPEPAPRHAATSQPRESGGAAAAPLPVPRAARPGVTSEPAGSAAPQRAPMAPHRPV